MEDVEDPIPDPFGDDKAVIEHKDVLAWVEFVPVLVILLAFGRGRDGPQ